MFYRYHQKLRNRDFRDVDYYDQEFRRKNQFMLEKLTLYGPPFICIERYFVVTNVMLGRQ
jgi:hypothetical protein